jgi:hypothetical protein
MRRAWRHSRQAATLVQTGLCAIQSHRRALNKCQKCQDQTLRLLFGVTTQHLIFKLPRRSGSQPTVESGTSECRDGGVSAAKRNLWRGQQFTPTALAATNGRTRAMISARCVWRRCLDHPDPQGRMEAVESVSELKWRVRRPLCTAYRP